MRIVGIDIGKSSIKLVEIESSRRSAEVIDYHEMPYTHPSDSVTAAARLIRDLKSKPDRIALSLNGTQVTFRNLDVPTRDKKAIKALVLNELEDELPFEEEDMVHLWTFLSESKRHSRLHIEATLKKYVAEMIASFQEFEIDPDVITSRIWSLRALFNALIENPNWEAYREEPILHVDLGAESSTLYVHYLGNPVFFHEVKWGGNDLTRAIAKHYNVNEAEAEKAKIDSGFVLSSQHMAKASNEQKEFSSAIHDSLMELSHEVRQAALSSKAILGKKVHTVFFSGGSSLLPGIRQAVEDEIHIPVRPLNALSNLSTSSIQYSEASDAKFVSATGIGLSLSGNNRRNQINFRTGDLSKTGSKSSNFDWIQPVTWASAVLASMLISMVVEKNVYQGRLEDADRDVRNALSTFYGGGVSENRLRVALADPEKLQKDLDLELKKTRAQAQLMGANPQSPLDFLKTLSQNIESRSVVDMIQFTVGSAPEKPYAVDGEQKVELEFLYSNPQIKEQISASIKNILSDIEESKVEEVASPEDPSLKKYKIRFSGIPKESAYGG